MAGASSVAAGASSLTSSVAGASSVAAGASSLTSSVAGASSVAAGASVAGVDSTLVSSTTGSSLGEDFCACFALYFWLNFSTLPAVSTNIFLPV